MIPLNWEGTGRHPCRSLSRNHKPFIYTTKKRVVIFYHGPFFRFILWTDKSDNAELYGAFPTADSFFDSAS